MRTTVTMDAVKQMLRLTMKEKGISFKEALNQAIRADVLKERRGRAQRFSQQTLSMGAEQQFRWDKALAVADAIEDRIVRK